MMAVDISLNDAPEMGQPRLLFEKPRSLGISDYDVMPDGNRFIMLDYSDAVVSLPTELVLVQHFAEELKRLAPVDN